MEAVWLARWTLALIVIAWAAAPLARRLVRPVPDADVVFALALGLVWLAFGGWLMGRLVVPYAVARPIAVLSLVAVGVVGRTRAGRRLGLGAPWWPPPAAWAVFIAALLAFAGVRALLPDVSGAEKFMDFALFNGTIRTDRLPPDDPWMAGVPLNYYYGGYLLFAGPARCSGVPAAVAYNLALATVGAVLFSASTAIGRLLTGRTALGALGGIAAAVMGNLDAARQLVLERRGLAGFDYWRSTRVVPDTINEFPFFSVLHGDLHPHLTAAVVVPCVLGVVAAAACGTEPRIGRARLAALAVLVAALVVTNPWDAPACVAVVGVAAIGLRRRTRGLVASAARGALDATAVVAAALALSSPFLLAFRSPTRGLGWVHARTMLGPFLTVFGALLLPVALDAARRFRGWLPAERDRRDFAAVAVVLAALVAYVATASWPFAIGVAVAATGAGTALAGDGRVDVAVGAFVATAGLLVAACELVFVRDAYGEALHRMNTVFKLYFTAWVLLAAALPALLRHALSRAPRLLAGAAGVVAAAAILASLAYPIAAVVTRARARTAAPTLDGLAWLARQHPGDRAAIAWFRDHAGAGAVVLEATGDPYGYFARISANTGLPTVLGWANHERVWRGDDPRIAERVEAVKRIYAGAADAHALLARYRVRYVVVGALERTTYGAQADWFADDAASFVPVLRADDTAVYALRGGDQSR